MQKPSPSVHASGDVVPPPLLLPPLLEPPLDPPLLDPLLIPPLLDPPLLDPPLLDPPLLDPPLPPVTPASWARVPLKKSRSTASEIPLTLPLSEFCQKLQVDHSGGMPGHVTP